MTLLSEISKKEFFLVRFESGSDFEKKEIFCKKKFLGKLLSPFNFTN